ncbi:site-specific integrase [Blastococcus sp. MG754426]|uniref:tyrosine-type recombinase/integrase n=1 Tax=unclassified Blastococcus TaxID=2619396 RepID=UPI001EF013DE|nr:MULTISPECIES: site-specific integrase [unclassified Blastococcus]MCF6507383.1 site-specific integrase [Blastococcus sp. MG754426]MCF6511455.1 site-specific integrase [Blastococcus sp. MG754427]
MASVEPRLTRRNGRDAKVYDVRFRDPDGRQRKKTFGKKGDADRFAATVEADKLRGQYVDHSHRVTVAEYARAWASARPHRPTTARRVSSLIETHIAGTKLGDRRLSAVRPSEVQAWASDRAQVLAPSTLRNLVSLLRSIYASAVLDRLTASSPVVRVALPRHERPRVIPLTVPQVQALADAMPARNRAMVLTQAGLGLRIGELLALRVEDVDFLRRTARVEWQIAPGAKMRSEPKTPRSRRTVPLPQVVADALAAHLAEFPAGEDGSIFTTTTGAVYRHDYYGSMIFAAAVEKAGLPTGTTSHDLRHHYASVLLAAGESVVAVAERLGHENATLVLKTYGHLMPDSEDRTRRAVDEAWCATTVPLAQATAR